MKKYYLLLALLLPVTAVMGQKADTIITGKPLEKFQLLKPTTRQYMRYLLANGKRLPIDIWTRKVTFEHLNGKPAVHIYQVWEGADSTKNRMLDSWFEMNTFKPFTHERTTGKVLESFTFGEGKVRGTDKPGNTQKDFSVDAPEPTFNFETDMETFQMLPLKQDYVAVINFYHPGSQKPDWYTFKVDGSESMMLPSGKKMDCWILSTDYNSPERGRTRYWLEKGTQLFVKQETPVRGGFLYKMLFAAGE